MGAILQLIRTMAERFFRLAVLPVDIGSRILVVSLLVVLWGSCGALAQVVDEPKGYVVGGFTLAWQPDEDPGPEDTRYLASSTLGGLSAGLHAGVGVHIGQPLSAGVEVSIPGAVSGERELWGGGGQSFATHEVQETMITALLRGHIGRGRVQFQPMGGFTWTRTRSSLVEGYTRSITGTVMPLIPSERTDLETGITGGVDVAAALSPHVALSPYARVHWVARPDPARTPDYSVLPAVVYRFGVALVGRW